MRKLILTIALVAVIAMAGLAGDITATGIYQGDLFTFLSNVVTIANEQKADYNLLRNRVNNHLLGYATFNKASTNTANLSIASGATVDYTINGIIYQITDQQDASYTVTFSAQATGTDCLYLVEVDTAGNFYVTKGTSVTVRAGTEVWPAATSTRCVVGGFKLGLDTIATGTFTVGSTKWTTYTHATYTAYQLFYPPTGTTAPTAVSASDLSLTGL